MSSSAGRDFPIEPSPAALTGAQPKMAMVFEDGVYRAQSDALLAGRIERFGPLIEPLAKYCRESMGTGRILHEKVALDVGLELLRCRRWFTDAQNVWIMRRVAEHLGWPPLDNEAGTVKWVEYDEPPFDIRPSNPNVRRPISLVERRMRAAQGKAPAIL